MSQYHPPIINDVAQILEKEGLALAEGPYFFEIVTDLVSIRVEPSSQPAMGRLLVSVIPRNRSLFPFEAIFDRFPRHYFNASACAMEIVSWMKERGVYGNSEKEHLHEPE